MTMKQKSGKVIPVDQAVGQVLAHDITEIRPGQFKGPAFKKGHIVRPEDLDHLKRLGKENIFVLMLGPDDVHENEAAGQLAKALAGEGVLFDEQPSEGKISLRSAYRGLLKVDVDSLTELNMVPDITCASRHNNTLVEKGDIIASTRAIPLVIDADTLEQGLSIPRKSGGIFSIKRLSSPDTGLIITGNEVYHGRIEDKFGPVIRKKLEALGCHLKETLFAPDDREFITEAIKGLLEKGLGLILVAGGMSVDPDDVSRMAIAQAGASDLVYGTPVLPGAMFLYGHFDGVPVLGLPACVLYYKATVFDILLPRVLAGERIIRKDLAAMAHGGLCLDCRECRYPVCPFGKCA
ncbi:MAG: molybdopterin-binding protein [Deltaproteobacteria bacterium]|nr:molybdopterin-binding protein [Deltaproteobacteria bacterium]MBW2136347.1 molybdopterin-binding protein [Deltaproteobacteria bacterium]